MAVDGSITIGTELSTNKFDRQIADLQKKMKREEDKKILIEAKLNVQQQDLDKARKDVDQLAESYQRFKEIQDIVRTGTATASQFSLIQDFQNTYGSLDTLETKFNRALDKQTAIEQKVNQTKTRYDELNSRVQEYKQKIESVKIQQQVSEVDKLKQSFNSLATPIQNAIGKVARLALGIFGIRSAYMLVRRASSDLASYDKQYATNLEYIRYALANAIAPVLRWIVSATATILHYIGIILNSLFGINIFSNSSAKAFTNMKKGASGVSKAVGEIKKQLAGFDEMNVLQDNGNVSAGGGGGGIATPDFDFSNLDRPIPKWLEWLVDHKNDILGLFAGIVTYSILAKTHLSKIKALGIGIIIWGIVDAILSLIKYLKNPSFKNFGDIVKSIGIAILGLGIVISSLPVAIAGAITIIVGLVVKNWDKIKAVLQNGINWLKDKSDWVHKMFGDTFGNIYDTIVTILQLLLNFFDRTFTRIKAIFDGFITFFKGVFTGNWNMVLEGLKSIFVNTFEFMKDLLTTVFSAMFKVIKSVLNTISDIFNGLINLIVREEQKIAQWLKNTFINVVNAIGTAFQNLGNKVGSILNNMKTAFANIGSFLSNVFRTAVNNVINFLKSIPNFLSNLASNIKRIFANMGSTIGISVSTGFKNVINAVLNKVESVLKSPINAINSLIDKVNEIPGVSLNKINTFKLPRLKAGGILNVPNKGTLIGGGTAIGGEGGHEGYIPLSDSQAMETLGEAIGRHVVINASVVNNMNGRMISKALQQIQNERDFAYNT